MNGAPRARVRSALATALFALTAAADPLETGAFRLDWSAPPGCPDATETLVRIEALLGGPVAPTLKAPLTARAHVNESGREHFELDLETFQDEQRFTRELEARSCSELTDAAALVLALAIDPKLRERLPETVPSAATSAPAPASTASAESGVTPSRGATGASSATPASTTGTSSPPAPAARAAQPPTPRAAPFVLLAGTGVVADLGSVASVSFGPALTFGARLSSLELDLDALWLPPARSYAELDTEKGGDVSLLAFAVRPCFAPRQAPFETGACGLFELGNIWGEGFGTATQTTRHALWMAAGGALFLRYGISDDFRLSARLNLLRTLQDTEFTLQNVGVVHQVPEFVGRLGVGAEVHFD